MAADSSREAESQAPRASLHGTPRSVRVPSAKSLEKCPWQRKRQWMIPAPQEAPWPRFQGPSPPQALGASSWVENGGPLAMPHARQGHSRRGRGGFDCESIAPTGRDGEDQTRWNYRPVFPGGNRDILSWQRPTAPAPERGMDSRTESSAEAHRSRGSCLWPAPLAGGATAKRLCGRAGSQLPRCPRHPRPRARGERQTRSWTRWREKTPPTKAPAAAREKSPAGFDGIQC